MRADWPKEAIKVRLWDDIHQYSYAHHLGACTAQASYDMALSAYRFSALPTDLLHLDETKRDAMVIFPHSVPDDPPLPQREDAAGTFVLGSGGGARAYPFLHAVKAIGLPGITWVSHPGYGNKMAEDQAKWFPTLSQFRVGIVGLGWGRGGYVLAKYLEYPYAGLLLLAERPSERDCEVLGVRDGENCFLFDWPKDKDRFTTILSESLQDPFPFSEIAAAGQQLALSRHRASLRLGYLKRLIAYYQEHRCVPSVEKQVELFQA
jgi:hypothetical protein